MQVVVRSSTAAVGSPCIEVDVGSARVAGGGMVLWQSTGDATLGVMGTSGTSSIVGRLTDPSLFANLFVALGAVTLGVIAGNPGTLRGTGAWMTGGGVGARTGGVIPDGGL